VVILLGALKASGFAIQNPVLLFALAIVFSSFVGGFLSGFCSVCITCIYVFVEWSIPGALFTYTPVNIQRLVVVLTTMPLMAWLVCRLHRTSEQRLQALADKTEELKESRARLQRAELVAMTGNWEVDMATGSLTTSEGARRLYGLGDVGMTLQEALDRPLPQYRDRLDALWKGLLDCTEPYDVEYKIKRPTDGALIDIHSRATYNPETGKIFGIIQDITASKQVEAALIEARQRADEANQAKSRFLATMSHEIRTPLNGLLGLLQVLEDARLSAKDREYVQAALIAARHLEALVSDLLDISRIEAGRLEVVREPFELPGLIVQAWSSLAAQAEQTGVGCHMHLDAGLPERVLGDAQKVRRVLTNIVSNAVKFSPDGEVRLHASLVRTADGTATVRCLVSDTGLGVAESFLPRLCTTFSQERVEVAQASRGIGLGLSIVGELMRLLGGELTLDSRQGEGTDVYLTFAFELPDGQPAAQTMARASAGNPALRVLLAEDDAISRIACRRLLERLGHAVVATANGAQALDALAENDFDLIVMDLQMPEMDGLVAINAIRSQPRFRDKARIPIVVMTACVFTEDRDRCLAAGADAYLPKPVEKDRLGQAIEKALNARRV
jgi:signal transduction histidine kinase/CheY-like chemotaxis protein